MDLLLRVVRHILLIAAFSDFGAIAAVQDHQTIASLEAFDNLQPCARKCIANDDGWCWNDYIGRALGCDNSCDRTTGGAPNTCYCRTDYIAVATDYLSNCVLSACTLGDNSRDLGSALDLYNGYCNSLGYTEPPVTKTLTLTDATDSPGGPVTATPTLPGSGPEIVATQTVQTPQFTIEDDDCSRGREDSKCSDVYSKTFLAGYRNVKWVSCRGISSRVDICASYYDFRSGNLDVVQETAPRRFIARTSSTRAAAAVHSV
ncbi:hypothetical protein V8F20_006436 [Naviculisporaceae sp. PSN 640]